MHAPDTSRERNKPEADRAPDVAAYLALVGSGIGPYDVVALIGKGGMAAVYIGQHRALGHRVAIKILHVRHMANPAMIRRFANEARSLAAIRHPGVVQVHDIRRHTDGRPYIVMELLEGESLRKRLKQGPLPEEETVTFARQIASALGAAHTRGIVHRDIKPDNVFLVRDPETALGERAKVLDFGIAKVSEPHGDGLTRTGMLIGTPEYMSPEQCKGTEPVDARADIYGLGILMYRMVTGRVPFQSSAEAEILDNQIHREVPPARSAGAEISAEFDQVIQTCLAKDPARRFPSMFALAERLAQIEDMLEEMLEAQGEVDTNAITRIDPVLVRVETVEVSEVSEISIVLDELESVRGSDIAIDAERAPARGHGERSQRSQRSPATGMLLQPSGPITPLPSSRVPDHSEPLSTVGPRSGDDARVRAHRADVDTRSRAERAIDRLLDAPVDGDATVPDPAPGDRDRAARASAARPSGSRALALTRTADIGSRPRAMPGGTDGNDGHTTTAEGHTTEGHAEDLTVPEVATPVPEPIPPPRFVGVATSSGIPLPLPAEPSEPVEASGSESVVIPRPVLVDRSSGRRAVPHPVLSELSSSLFDAASRHGTGRVVLPPHVRVADSGTGRTPAPLAVGTGPLVSSLSLPAINRELDQLGLSAIPRPVLADASRYVAETSRVVVPVAQSSNQRRLVWATIAGLGAGIAAFVLASAIGLV